MHAIEFTFDEDGEAWFRRDWEAVLELGLPSHARRTHSWNAPHLSIIVGPHLPPKISELAVEHLGALIGHEISFGGVLLFGDGPYVLTRPVQCSPQFLTVTGAFLAEALQHCEPLRDVLVPHVTLARRVKANRLAEVDAVLQPARGVTATLTGLRYCALEDGIHNILI